VKAHADKRPAVEHIFVPIVRRDAADLLRVDELRDSSCHRREFLHTLSDPAVPPLMPAAPAADAALFKREQVDSTAVHYRCQMPRKILPPEDAQVHHASADGISGAGPDPSLQPCVLVVDDFRDGREMLAEYLSFRGFEVLTANDGAEAIAVATARRPAVILMDLTMPGIDGWEATARLKSDPRTERCIIIAVSGNALTTEEARALRVGADAFVGKPFDLTMLADAVGRLVSQGSAALSAFSVGQGSQRRETSRTEQT
jgi:two-component system cell cycle response regulator DivK